MSPEELARNVLNSLLEGCQVIGFDERYLYLNDTAAAQGHRPKEELLGRTMAECYPGIEQTPMFALLKRCMQERVPQRLENEFAYPDGGRRWFELRFQPVPEGVCILSLDITAAKQTALALMRSEDQLRQSQKMEAIGRLAGGVAHDFNNLLSVVLSYAQLLLAEPEASEAMRADLEEIRKAGERGAELTSRLLTFSRQQLVEQRVLDLNEIIDNMKKLLRTLVGEDVELRFVPAKQLGRIKADPGQIEQVVMNLVVNARDAMPGGGTITIETQSLELDYEYTAQHLGVAPGNYVMLAVSDTGTGIDKVTQERMFEPFYTTKARGKGTGLGLSTVFGIVQQSRGSIWAYSELGQGATFKVYLPRCEQAEHTVLHSLPPVGVRGSETILLVEDEQAVRAVASGILGRHGYSVLEASNGDEALRLSEQHRGAIDLLLTDVVMPHMSGRELSDRLLALRPRLKVLYMSGYTDDAILPHRVLESGVLLLQKPLRPNALLKRVREALERG
ncbi:MAG TPA: ATP-binding protein [Polyangiales bacterium]|nr:ATP-binding protein [Polyangiales bacterium]